MKDQGNPGFIFKYLVCVFGIWLLIFGICSPASVHAGYLDKFEKGSLPRISLPHVRTELLKNGIRCFLLEDHTLPMVKIEVVTRVGSIYDPPEEVGLAELTGMLMRSGGAGGLSPEEFDSAVDNLGAQLSSWIGPEMGKAELKTLSGDLEKGLALLFDMIFAPRFDDKRLNVARLKIEERLLREDDDPDQLVARHFRQFVYGEQNPWARRPSHETLMRISSRKIRAFHEKYFKTNNLLLAAAGDFDSNELIAMVERLTETVPQGEIEFPDVPDVDLEFKPATKLIEKPLTQSFIRMGHLGIKRHNQDKYALILATDILGAANFKSRLMEDIRTRRGLAYSIWSNLTLETDYGLFLVGADTKSGQAAQVIELIRGHIERMAGGEGVSHEELKFARQSVLSRLIFDFDNAFNIVAQRAAFYFYGYPDNYWLVFRDRIAQVSADDVRKVSAQYLHPEGLKVVVVGPMLPEGEKKGQAGIK